MIYSASHLMTGVTYLKLVDPSVLPTGSQRGPNGVQPASKRGPNGFFKNIYRAPFWNGRILIFLMFLMLPPPEIRPQLLKRAAPAPRGLGVGAGVRSVQAFGSCVQRR